MIFRHRNITVRQLPATLDARGRKVFSSVFEECINVDRPMIVLDCGRLVDLDVCAIHFLLCCLEEAMKRNGDIRLAALAPDAKARIEMAQADRIFEIYDTIAEATDSYSTPHMTVAAPVEVMKNAFQAA